MNNVRRLFLIISLFSIYTTLSSQGLLIKPERTITFTTEEASEMDVDISPDGKTLVFTILGDLFTVPAKGGRATQITRGLALNIRPCWSPDGKKIAYLSDASGSLHLTVRDLQGRSRVLDNVKYFDLNFTNPIWTSEGYFLNIADSIYSLTGAIQPLPSEDIQILRFSPDGRYMYYLEPNDSGLWRLNLCDSSKVEITGYKVDPIQNPGLSADGRWFAYILDTVDGKHLVISDLEHGTRRILIPHINKWSKEYLTRYSFSADSKRLYIGYEGKIHEFDLENETDNIIPFQANVIVDLGKQDYNTFHVSLDSLHVRYVRSARICPDGKHLLFSALGKIYYTSMGSKASRSLVSLPWSQFQPAYSPDGKWVAFVTWSDTAGGALWRVQENGEGLEKLSNEPGLYQHPTWSWDGQVIAVVQAPPKLGERDDEGKGSLELIPVGGGNIRIVDSEVPLRNQLTFSHDGERIMYQPKANAYNDGANVAVLVSKKLDGSGFRIVASCIKDLGVSGIPRQIIPSPDGRYIVYSRNENLYLAPVCNLGGPVNIYNPDWEQSVFSLGSGVDPYWDADGSKLSWTYGNSFFSIRLNRIIKAADSLSFLRTPLQDSTRLTVILTPDLQIPIHLSSPRLFAHGIIALRNARILTMEGDKVIEHGTIIIKDGRFTAVGPVSDVIIPIGTKVFDLDGKTVMPGFIDLHSHIRLSPDVFPQQPWQYLINLAYGVTTIRDPASNFDSFEYGEMLDVGDMVGPRLFTVGVAVYSGVCGGCNSMYSVQNVVDKRKVLGGTIIKQYANDTRIQRQRVLLASLNDGLNMTNEGLSSIIVQLGMIKDGSTGIEHNPDWRNVFKDLITIYAKSGVFLTPTLQVSYDGEPGMAFFNTRYWHEPVAKIMRYMPSLYINYMHSVIPKDTAPPDFLERAQVDARIVKDGGHITLGSHGENQGIGFHSELWALQMGGLSNLQALQAATIVGAESLGIQNDVGSVKVGKIADLIVLDKDPLEDIHNSVSIRYVMKAGILYDGDSLKTIWPYQRVIPDWRFRVKDNEGGSQ